MGVDYTGNYGIGCEVRLNELYFEQNEVDRDDWDTSNFLEYLDDILENNDTYEYIETGSEMYGGIKNKVYLVLKEPFVNGYNITFEVINFKKFCQDNLLDMVNEVNIVGGLLID